MDCDASKLVFGRRHGWLTPLHAWLAILLLSLTAATTSAQSLNSRSGVLIPLYVYPSGNAWDPIFEAIQTHPSLDFTIVINPANGPGEGPQPTGDWQRALVRLHSFPNVRTLGYVPLNYGKRPLDGAIADVTKYADWKKTNPALGVQGIFLDESPQLATQLNTTLLASVKSRIRAVPGLASGGPFGRDPLVAMNPGSIPDVELLDSMTDRTVVFEDQYSVYVKKQTAKAVAALPDRDVLVVLMHSVPVNMPREQLRELISELKELAGTLFLTDIAEGYYNQISPRLREYIDALV